jgi:hypothetical protein
MDLREISSEDGRWKELAQGRAQLSGFGIIVVEPFGFDPTVLVT